MFLEKVALFCYDFNEFMEDIMCLSLELHKGEILGIGGLSECGMHRLGKAVFGAEEIVDGKVYVGNTVVKNTRVANINSRVTTNKGPSAFASIEFKSRSQHVRRRCLLPPVSSPGAFYYSDPT